MNIWTSDGLFYRRIYMRLSASMSLLSFDLAQKSWRVVTDLQIQIGKQFLYCIWLGLTDIFRVSVNLESGWMKYECTGSFYMMSYFKVYLLTHVALVKHICTIGLGSGGIVAYSVPSHSWVDAELLSTN